MFDNPPKEAVNMTFADLLDKYIKQNQELILEVERLKQKIEKGSPAATEEPNAEK